MGFLKSYGPETPIISIENQNFKKIKRSACQMEMALWRLAALKIFFI